MTTYGPFPPPEPRTRRAARDYRYNHSDKGRARWRRYWDRNADRLNRERNTRNRTAAIDRTNAMLAAMPPIRIEPTPELVAAARRRVDRAANRERRAIERARRDMGLPR